jgi:hypothetical protein
MQSGLLLRRGFLPELRDARGRQAEEVEPGAARDHGQSALLQEPQTPVLNGSPYDILITGVGGTGVITIGALLGMAAHRKGKGVSVLDMTGMSQKNGAVTSHVRIAAHPERILAQRIATGEANFGACGSRSIAVAEGVDSVEGRAGSEGDEVSAYQVDGIVGSVSPGAVVGV